MTRWVTKQSRKATDVGSDWVQLVSNVLSLPKNEPDTWAIAARLLPHALAAVELAYRGNAGDTQPVDHSEPGQDIAKSTSIKTLLAGTREFFDDSRSRFEKTCFVIMPFGKKQVSDVPIDFDAIYKDIFVPAIECAELPDGGALVPVRAVASFFSGAAEAETFRYLEYSRIAVCDITSLNADVFYELGIRHRARSSGTAIFRQVDAPMLFDINQIRVFPYDPRGKEESRQLITSVLTESLRDTTRMDSPIHLTRGGSDRA